MPSSPRSSCRCSRPPPGPDDPGFWLYSSGSTGCPRAVHTHANPYWTAELYGRPGAGPGRERTSAGSRPPAVLRHGLGNPELFRVQRGRDDAADGRAADARRRCSRLDGRHRWRARPAHGVLRRAHGLCGHALRMRSCPHATRGVLRFGLLDRQGCRPRSANASSAHFGIDIVDGIGSTGCCTSSCPTDLSDIRYGTTDLAGGGLPHRWAPATNEQPPVADGEPGESVHPGPALMY